MTKPNELIDSLKKRFNASGWTPGKKDVTTLIEHWLEFTADERETLEKVLAKMDQLAVGRSVHLWPNLNVRVKGDWARPLGRAILKNQHDEAVSWLAQMIVDEADSRVRKGFIQAVGAGLQAKDKDIKYRKTLVDAVLAAAERKDLPAPEIKALTETLGKSADPRALVVLKSLASRGGDTTRSEMILERDNARSEEAADVKIDLSKLMDGPDGIAKNTVCWFVPGIETLATRTGVYGSVDKLAAGALLVDAANGKALRANMLWLEIGTVLGELSSDDISAVAQLVAKSEGRLRKAMQGLEADSKIRIRFDHRTEDHTSETEKKSKPGKKLVGPWAFAEALTRENCGIISDGRDSHWQMRLMKHGNKTLVVIVARKSVDDRWAWRTIGSQELDGSSQSTVAAAIVALAAPRVNDIIWDPFCGAGTELFIASQLTDGKVKLLGTDINPDAIQAARSMAKKQNVTVELRQSDALAISDKFSMVVTNPPFGMRTARGEARGILESFFLKLRGRLTSGGRFVLLSHAPAATAGWGKAAGFKLVESIPVKLGGMTCELQRFE